MTTWDEVVRAVEAALTGRSEQARRVLEETWNGTAADEHAQRCVLARYLADQQTDLAEETAWDERALEEHTRAGDSDLLAMGVSSAAGFAPSLHLNLADDYRRAGLIGRSREHLSLAR